MSNIEKKLQARIAETSEKIGCEISVIRDQRMLEAAYNDGLITLYQSVFSEPPYNESFAPDEVRQAFDETLKSKGVILIAREQKPQGSVIAFVSSIPLAVEREIAALFRGRLDVAKGSYFAEDATRSDYRRRGISTALKRLLLACNYQAGAENVVLRTTYENYRQIAAVYKIGGTLVEGLTQNVVSRRADGRGAIDKRVFLLFNQQSETFAGCIDKVSIARPGGNDTALVETNVARACQGAVSLDIQRAYPCVEQVMFIEDGASRPRGQMAGGEFCGNATRALGNKLLGGADGGILLDISGAQRPLRVESRGGRVQTEVPVRSDRGNVRRLPKREGSVIEMDGIAFFAPDQGCALAEGMNAIASEDQQKERATQILTDLGLTNRPACGLLLTEKDGDSVRLTPYVFVRDTGTMYKETACGSGSAALGLLRAAEEGGEIRAMEIVQPSGMSLYVSVARDGESFKSATVSGPVQTLFDGRLYLPRPCVLG